MVELEVDAHLLAQAQPRDEERLVADRLGVEPDALSGALRQAMKNRIDAYYAELQRASTAAAWANAANWTVTSRPPRATVRAKVR